MTTSQINASQPDDRTGVIEYLRAQGAAELRQLIRDAKLADAWLWYDDEGGPVDPEEEEAGEDGCPPTGGYLQSYGGTSIGTADDCGGPWCWRVYGGTSAEDVTGSASSRKEVAEAVEQEAVKRGWRLPWRPA